MEPGIRKFPEEQLMLQLIQGHPLTVNGMRNAVKKALDRLRALYRVVVHHLLNGQQVVGIDVEGFPGAGLLRLICCCYPRA